MLNYKEIFTFILTPLLLYPYWLGITFLQNRFVGDNSLYLWIQFDRNRSLVYIIRDDWLSALPASYIFVLIFLMPSYYLLKSSHSYSFFNFLMVGLLLAVAACFYFIGYNFYALAISILCSTLLVVTITLINGIISWKKK